MLQTVDVAQLSPDSCGGVAPDLPSTIRRRTACSLLASELAVAKVTP